MNEREPEAYEVLTAAFSGLLVFLVIFLALFIAHACDAQEREIPKEIRAQRHYQGIRAAAASIAEWETDKILVNAAQRIVANSEEPADGNFHTICYWPSLRTILNNGYRGQARAFKLYGGDSEQNVLYSTILIHTTILTEAFCDAK